MPDTTVQPGIPIPDPEHTDRYPEVQAIVDRFVSPAAAAQEATVSTPIDEATAREIVADVAILVPVPEQDTDTGWARLAGLLGIDPHSAVA